MRAMRKPNLRRGVTIAMTMLVALISTLVVGKATGLPIVDAAHIPGFGWVESERGVPVPQDVIDRATDPSQRGTLAEAIQMIREEREAERERPPKLGPFEDQGERREIAAVREAVTRILRDDLIVQIGTSIPADARARFESNYSSATLEKEWRAYVKAMQMPVAPGDVIETVAVDIEQWRGIAVDGDRAVALARGTEVWTLVSGPVTVPTAYQMSLVRERGEWKRHFLYSTNLNLTADPAG